MGFTPHIYIIMLIFAVFSCASSGEEQTSNKDTDMTAEQHANNSDSLPDFEPVQPPPSPGTARIKGNVISVDTSNNGQNIILHIKIQQTLAYGSSTPAIAPQDTLQLSASQDHKNIQVNDTLTAEIRYREPLAISGTSSLQWFLVNIEQNANQK